MKARFVFACAAAGIALSAFGATTASAEGDFVGSIGFMPDAARPGDSVDVFGSCNDPKFTTAPVVSDILDAPDLTGTDDGNGGWHLTSFATVRKDAKPGNWPVSFQCGTTNVVGHLQIDAAEEPEPYAAIGIQDREIKPGQEVMVVASCQDPKFTSSKVTSPVLTAADLVRKKGGPVDSPIFADGKINDDVKPGTYPISFTCVDREITGEFTVVAERNPAPVKKKAQVPVKPKGAADTGSLDAAPAPEQQDTSLYVLGGTALAALGAVGGAGAWAYRRRQRA